jgi:hypothetical protein
VQLTINVTTLWRVLGGILVGLLAAAAIYFWFQPQPPFDGTVNPDRWQAVFLEDGRIYFGRLEPGGEDFYVLRDAFFLQETPPEEEGDVPGREIQPVSAEFHGPENLLVLSIEHVVVIENLSPQSEVTAAIERVLAEA